MCLVAFEQQARPFGGVADGTIIRILSVYNLLYFVNDLECRSFQSQKSSQPVKTTQPSPRDSLPDEELTELERVIRYCKSSAGLQRFNDPFEGIYVFLGLYMSRY